MAPVVPLPVTPPAHVKKTTIINTESIVIPDEEDLEPIVIAPVEEEKEESDYPINIVPRTPTKSPPASPKDTGNAADSSSNPEEFCKDPAMLKIQKHIDNQEKMDDVSMICGKIIGNVIFKSIKI